MTRRLSVEHEALIDELVELGQYDDFNHVVADALNLLNNRLKVEALQEKLDIGARQLEQGESVVWSPEWSAAQRERVRQRAAAGEKPHPDVCP